MAKNSLLIFVFLLCFGMTKAQVTAYAYPSETFSEETISQILTESKKKGTADWELNILKKHLYERLERYKKHSGQTPAARQQVPNVVQQSCSNVDFEQGNYSGWTLTSGNINSVTLPCNTCPTGAGGIANVTTATNSGATWTNGIDNCTGQPAVAPGGGVYSLCLNDNTAGGKMQMIKQTFNITPTNNVFTYQYLAVLQDGGHAATDQPYFFSQMVDGSGNPIACTYYMQSAASAISGWTPAPGCPGTNYKGWVTVTLDMSSYIGTSVTIQFLVSDCNQGGHYGYAYIDGDCNQIQVNNTVTICPGSTQLCGPPGFSTYSWSGPVTGNTMCLNTSTAGSYTLVTTGQCPAPTRYYTVNVSPTPTVNFTSTVTPCNNTVPFTDLSTLSSGSITGWSWSFGDGGTSTAQNPSHNYAGAGTYNVVLTCTSSAGCSDSYSTAVTLGNGPNTAFSANPACLGTASSFTNTSSPGSYTWDFGDSSPLDTNANPSHTYSASGSYVVTLSVSANGCSASVTNTVVVKPLPVLNPIATISQCDQTQIATPAFVSNPAGATVSWTNNNTVIGLAASGSGNVPVFTATSDGSGNVISGVVTATPTLNGCVGTPMSFTLSVTPQPTLTLSSPAAVCPNSIVQAPGYTVNPNNPATQYAWINNNPAVGLAANGIGIPPAFTAAANNTFANITSVVSVTPAVGTCVGQPATFTITIYPTPVIDPIANVEYCPNVNSPGINLSLQPAGGQPYFTWFNSNTAIGLSAPNGTVNPIPSFVTTNTTSAAIVSNLSVGASLNGCTAIPVPFTITINPNPVPDFKSDSKICEGSPMSFTDLSTVGSGYIAQWAWTLDGNGGSFATSQNPQYAIQPAGQHTITLTASTNKNCSSSVSKPIYINYIPVANFSGGGQGCPDLTVNNFQDLSTTVSPDSIATWSWTLGNGATSNLQTPVGPFTYGNTSAVSNMVYNVSLTVKSDSGCVSPAYSSACVTVNPHPVAGFSWGPGSPAPDLYSPIVEFYDESMGASGANGVTWNLGDLYAPNQQSNFTSVQNPSHTYGYEEATTYTVTQYVQNIYSCKDSITKVVEIQPVWSFYCPNAFSPNGDGTNEFFRGYGIGIDNSTYTMWIYDRWGNQVFYASDITDAWDGRFMKKGSEPVQQDVYVWKVRFKDYQGKKHEYNGTVSLIK